MTPLLLAVDPGSAKSGAVIVAPAPGGRIGLVRAGMVEGDAWASWLEGVSLVAIERAAGQAFERFRVPHLLDAQWAAGTLHGLAIAHGIPVLTAAAAEARKAVIGALPRAKKIAGVKRAANPMDALIAKALPVFVSGIEATTVHTRDACVLAVWAARTVWRRRAA